MNLAGQTTKPNQTMKIIDSHCHLNLEPLFSGPKKDSDQELNWQYFWEKAQENSLVGLIVPGTNLETSQRAISIADQANHIFAGAAIHPAQLKLKDKSSQCLDKSILKRLEKLKKLVTENPVVTIGETGLDYYQLKKNRKSSLAQLVSLQKQLFIKHIELANQVKLPLVIHVRDKRDCNSDEPCAYYDALDLVKKHYQFKKPAIFHCISGPIDYIKQLVSLDSYISVAGNVTYPTAQQIRTIVQQVPKQRLLVETDAPYLAPQLKRGQLNQPAFIKQTVEFMTENLGIKPDRLLANTLDAFDLTLN
jgi:TatD DNase family protein